MYACLYACGHSSFLLGEKVTLASKCTCLKQNRPSVPGVFSLDQTTQTDPIAPSADFPCICCQKLRAAIARVSFVVADTGSFLDPSLSVAAMSPFTCVQATVEWLQRHGDWIRQQDRLVSEARDARQDMHVMCDGMLSR